MQKEDNIIYNEEKTYKNLIDLRSRPVEERKKIARLGGLTRLEQIKKEHAYKKLLKLLLETDTLIEKYVKEPKSRDFNFNRKQMLSSGTNWLNYLLYDIEQLAKALDEEELREKEANELRKKQIRKAINRRYYLKRKERLKD
jgi:hypothetical protein